jgi:hypothetical protein
MKRRGFSPLRPQAEDQNETGSGSGSQMARVTPEQVMNYRDQRYRRRKGLRLRNSRQALGFINDVGFCWLFPAKDAEMPTLWEAICGESRPIPIQHDDQALGHAWDWKDELPSRGLVFYGKLLRAKPTLVSLELLPDFYALSENYGDIEDYLIEYQEGRLSDEARRVYEALLRHGAMPTSHLRRHAGLEGKSSALRFDRAIRELQLGLKIVKTGISDANSWGYCYVYDVLLRRFPELPARAGAIHSNDAMRVLLRTYLRNVGTASERSVARIFSWESARLSALSERCAHAEEIKRGVRVDGWPGEYLATPELL